MEFRAVDMVGRVVHNRVVVVGCVFDSGECVIDMGLND